ncbi:MAG TPA: phosphatidylinositol-specific phospholipase C [Planctomycetota bacterium]|nr:phosphatidylinositol-specific phospholipase C [Planctomycetota bacterium]
MDASAWMADVRGEASLAALSIPGSHDSAALHEPLPGTARCQTLTIAEQLAIGVRFLDLRCRRVGDALRLVHGPVDQRRTFDEALADCAAFLRARPSECLIVSVKEEGDPLETTRPFEDLFEASAVAATWRWTADIPSVDDARGTIVLLRRFPAARLPKGIDATAWVDDATFRIGDWIRVQDRYAVDDRDAKWQAIEDLLADPGDGSMRLNFVSGFEAPFGIPRIVGLATDLNGRLADRLDRMPRGGSLGIVVMDSVVADLAAAVLRHQPSAVPAAK